MTGLFGRQVDLWPVGIAPAVTAVTKCRFHGALGDGPLNPSVRRRYQSNGQGAMVASAHAPKGTAMEHDLEEPAIRELTDSELDSVSGGSVFIVRAKESHTFPTAGV